MYSDVRTINSLNRALHILEMRLLEVRRLEAKALRGAQESNMATPYFDAWTEAIQRANDTASAVFYLKGIITELEGTDSK